MFGEEWNERIETYVSVFIFGAIFLYVIVRFHGYRLKHHLKEKKWFLITSVATLVIGLGCYYHFVYNTPQKRIERLVEKYEENKRSLKNIDKLSEFFETEEFKKEMEEHKKKIEAIRLKNENAIPWISYGFYLVIFIYGCVFVHAWLREYRKQTPTKRT
jgi:hypothetical protein